MSRGSWNLDDGPFRGLYRDRENGWIFGVCAGLADRLNLNLMAVRIVAFVCLLVGFWVTLAVYLAAAFLLRDKPLLYSGQRRESDFWRRYGDERWRRL